MTDHEQNFDMDLSSLLAYNEPVVASKMNAPNILSQKLNGFDAISEVSDALDKN